MDLLPTVRENSKSLNPLNRSVYNTQSLPATYLQCTAAQCTIDIFECVCCAWFICHDAIQSFSAVIQYSHSVQSFNTVIQYSHSVQSFNTVIQCSYSIQSFNTVIQCSHSVQSFNTVIQCSPQLSYYRFEFDPMPVHVKFVLEKSTLGKVFVAIFLLSPESNIHVSITDATQSQQLTAFLNKTKQTT